jgi:Flp pilus assembly pilin Flp
MTALFAALHDMLTDRERVTALEYGLVAVFVTAALCAAIPGLTQVVTATRWGASLA